MTNKNQALAEIQKIIERFQKLPEAERSKYNEAQIRHSFILPLFRALGWDIENPAEMTAEELVSGGFADFGFYLNSVPVFYVETKRPREDLNSHIKQAINYAWLKGITWAVLTNFEEMKVFNADVKSTNPLNDIFLNLRWNQYSQQDFDLLWLLSKESFLQGQINEQAVRYGRMAQKEPVNQLLFAQLTAWRRDLFKNMRAYGNLFKEDTQKLDEAVQRFLDRLIFIRTVEDRQLEQPRLIQLYRQYEKSRKKGKNLFHDLRDLFREMDEIYNARLFAQHQLDLLDMHDDMLLGKIIEGLYNDPRGYGKYDFSAISADILGNIYEQYLSFKMLDPEGKQAVSDKHTKRKSQGIYYTPQFVVRYIVNQTLGKLLESGKVDPYKIRVLDPACGSGSFLIEAFDVLDRFLMKHGTPDHQQHHRKRRLHILRHNIYGVDLDPQAVEVAQLNLLLRAAIERGKLDTLEHIKVGNSLIDDAEVAGETAFNWQQEFPDVFADGGFDVIIGNPPYVRQEFLGAQKTYFQNHYEVYHGSADLYTYFMEKSVNLLKQGGLYSIIVSNKWMRANYGKPLRQWMKQQRIEEIIDFGDLPVFQGATVYPCILTLKKSAPQEEFSAVQVETLEFSSLDAYTSENLYSVKQSSLKDDGWSLANQGKQGILDNVLSKSVPLGEYIGRKFYRGILTGFNTAFIINEVTKKRLVAEDARSAELIKPFFAGRDIKRYESLEAGKYLIFTRRGIDIKRYPAIENYLAGFKEQLMPKPRDWNGGAWNGRKAGNYEWYEIQDTVDYHPEFEKPKIIYASVSQRGSFTLDEEGIYVDKTCYFLPTTDKYLLGLLNSSLLYYYFSSIGVQRRGGYYEYLGQYVEKLPIRKINFDDPTDKARHDELVQLVESMLQLKKDYAAADVLKEDRRHDIAAKISHTDAEIDKLVYGLYGLTVEEIAVVEGR